MKLLTALYNFFDDPHSFFALVGLGFVLTPEMAENLSSYVKLYSVGVGALIITVTGIHKLVQYFKKKA